MPIDAELERVYFHDHITGEPMRGLPDPYPCPFCPASTVGGVASVVGDRGGAIFQVICDSCGACGPAAHSPLDAAVAWNNRACRHVRPMTCTVAMQREPERVAFRRRM